MNCGKCNAVMVLDNDLPKSYHCPICQSKLFIINGHPKWFDADGNPLTPQSFEEDDEKLIKEIEEQAKKLPKK